MKRYEAIETIIQSLTGTELIISSTGMISRELFTIQDTPQNFYMLGSMGLASSIGLGLALSLPEKQVIVVEGDGSCLMNMGAMEILLAFDNDAAGNMGTQKTLKLARMYFNVKKINLPNNKNDVGELTRMEIREVFCD